jgi:hypothetical protein
MVGSDASARKSAASTLAKRRWARERERGPRLALLAGLGLQGLTPEFLAGFLKAADEFSEAERTRLARVIGGGVCEGSAALLVDAGALATAASRAAYATGDAALGARLSAEARSNLLGAHELCAREAKGRPRAQPAWMDLFQPEPALAPAVSTAPRVDAPSVSTAPEREQRVTEPEPEPVEDAPAVTPPPERPRFRFSFSTRTPEVKS